LNHGLVWPQNATFLDDYETAKRWLVTGRF
jgi:hypothetical protein